MEKDYFWVEEEAGDAFSGSTQTKGKNVVS